MIKSCNNANSLNCQSTKKLDLIACGGRAPYTWSKTGSLVLSRTTGPSVVVTPPTNSGSGTVGTAYTLKANIQDGDSGSGNCVAKSCTETFGCNDQSLVVSDVPAGTNTCKDCGGSPPGIQNGNCHESGSPQSTPSNCSTVIQVVGVNQGSENCQPRLSPNCMEDNRTAPMISAGCTPCGVNAGSTVTVTDALGTNVTIIVRA